jgi:transcriptional regulator with XRE-family HTH domain
MLKINLRILRISQNLTQAAMASNYFVSRQAWASYEEGRAEPKLNLLQKLSADFGYSIDSLLNTDISTREPQIDKRGVNLRLLPVVVDASNEETIPVVPQKAAAGYTQGYSDAEFIGALKQNYLNLPELKGTASRRLFQIKGDSMLPIPSGAYIICHYVNNWEQLKQANCYVFVTREDGIVFKRLSTSGSDHLVLQSDNPTFKEIELPFSEILEVWQAEGFIQLAMPLPGSYVPDMKNLFDEMHAVKVLLESERNKTQ